MYCQLGDNMLPTTFLQESQKNMSIVLLKSIYPNGPPLPTPIMTTPTGKEGFNSRP